MKKKCNKCKLEKLESDFYNKHYSCKECVKERSRKWSKDNPLKRNKSRRLYKKKKLKDPIYKCTKSLRHRVYMIFKNNSYKKRNSTKELLGATFEKVKEHIENKFEKGMNWDNHGEWHIDHIIPLSSAKNEDELTKLCYYKNLQPLWAIDNIKKSNTILNK